MESRATPTPTRWPARRRLQHARAQWPVFVIDATGGAHTVGLLKALGEHDYWFDGATRALDQFSSGLPFFLQDLWPQGFMGRALPGRFPELGLPPRVGAWNEAHALTFLTRRGEDSMGNLLLGEESLTRYFQQPRGENAAIDTGDRPTQYPALAEAALAGCPPGSSAGGEQPKFTAVVRNSNSVHHVLVKFSPTGNDRGARRWRDLLVAEHLATGALRSLGISAANTELVESGGRLFLESRRFDRFRARGRVGIVSLAAVADQYVGHRNGWSAAAADLTALGRISRRDACAIERAVLFGRLIGNTDMHFGNLSFFFSPGRGLRLAPLYDMLPMMYAPSVAKVPDLESLEVSFEGLSPRVSCGNVVDPYLSVAACAQDYWRQVAEYPLVSDEFRSRALCNSDAIRPAS